jgi:signal transduction histidine kinase
MNTPGSSGKGQEGMSLATALRGCLGAGVAFYDPAAQVVTMAPEAAQLLGFAVQASREPDWETLPVSLRQVAAEAAKTGRSLANRIVEIKTAAGRSRVLEITAIPVGHNGKVGVVLLLSNLEDLLHCEERLQRLDRLANLGTLAASMAHEIRNALVAGRTFVDLLLEKNPQAELTDVVRRELTRIDAIVARLLKFAAPARPALSEVRVTELLEHALRLLQPQLDNRDISLDRQLNTGADQVTGDEGELLQAFMNLLLNALEAMAPEGKLTVKTEPESKSGTIRITITDTGIGISPEHLPHLFDPFFTTKPSGTGLGLAVTKRIIEEHHGALTVESRPGQGTAFTIVLPVANEAA